MSKAKGGRGKRLPYERKSLWVPVDLIPRIEEQIERYHLSQMGEEVPPDALDRACEKILSDELITRKGKIAGLSDGY